MARPDPGVGRIEQAVGAVIDLVTRHGQPRPDRPEFDAELHDELVGSGLGRLLLPDDLGGLGLSPAAAFGVVERVSAASGAAGRQLLWHNMSLLLAWIPPEQRDLLLAAELPVVAGSTSPDGTGQVTADGPSYRLTGSWPSWVDPRRANLIIAGFWDTVGAERQELRIAMFRAAGQIGVRRRRSLNGDFEVCVGDLAVPAAHTVQPFQILPPAEAAGDKAGQLAGLTMDTVTLALLAATAIGVSTAAIECFARLARRKWRVTTRCALSDDPLVVSRVRSASAAAAAGRCLMLAELTAVAGDVGVAADVSGTAEHVMAAAQDITSTMFELGGAGAVLRQSPLQRCLGDIQAIRQHILLSDDQRIRAARIPMATRAEVNT